MCIGSACYEGSLPYHKKPCFQVIDSSLIWSPPYLPLAQVTMAKQVRVQDLVEAHSAIVPGQTKTWALSQAADCMGSGRLCMVAISRAHTV